jgi:hypothetical protein
MTYVLTRYAVRDAGTVERSLSGGTSSTRERPRTKTTSGRTVGRSRLTLAPGRGLDGPGQLSASRLKCDTGGHTHPVRTFEPLRLVVSSVRRTVAATGPVRRLIVSSSIQSR